MEILYWKKLAQLIDLRWLAVVFILLSHPVSAFEHLFCEGCSISIQEMDEIDPSSIQWLKSLQRADYQVYEWIDGDYTDIDMCAMAEEAFQGYTVKDCKLSVLNNKKPQWSWVYCSSGNLCKGAGAGSYPRYNCREPFPKITYYKGETICYTDTPICYYPYSIEGDNCVKYCPPVTPLLDKKTGICVSDEPFTQECPIGSVYPSSGLLKLESLDYIYDQIPCYDSGKGNLSLSFYMTYNGFSAPEADPFYNQKKRFGKSENNFDENSLEGWKRYLQPEGYKGIGSSTSKLIRADWPSFQEGQRRPGSKQWSHNHDARMFFSSNKISLMRSGRVMSFYLSEDGFYYAYNSNLKVGKVGEKWFYFDSSGVVDVYSSFGLIEQRVFNSNLKADYYYDLEGRLSFVENSLGSKLEFFYNSREEIEKVKLPNGESISYLYDEIGNIVKFELGSFKRIGFGYQDAHHPFKITQVFNDEGFRLASWEYDSLGRVISFENATGSISNYEYLQKSTLVKGPLGYKSKFNYKNLSGSRRLYSKVGAGNELCPDSYEKIEYDSRGLVVGRTKNGVEEGVSYDRNYRVSSFLEARGLKESRRFNYQWSTDGKYLEKIDRGYSRTEYSYDDNGNVTRKAITPR